MPTLIENKTLEGDIAKECNTRCVLETKTIAALKKSVGWLKKNRKNVTPFNLKY